MTQKYEVSFLVEVHCTVNVEADCVEDAKRMASDEVAFEWQQGDAAGWSVNHVEPDEDRQ